MVKKIFAYLAVFLFSLLIFLVVLTPASFIWERVVSPKVSLAPYGAKVKQVHGRIWEGQVLFNIQGIDSILAWNLRLNRLVALQLPVDLELKSHAGSASASVVADMGGVHLNLASLDARLSALNKSLTRRRIKLDGLLVAKDIRLSLKDERLIAAEGQFSWSGGQIAYPVRREQHERDVPSFQGRITTREDGTTYIGIADPGSDFDPIEVSLTPEGVALLQVRRRLLDLVDEPWSSNSDARDVVFKIKKDIY